MARVFQTLAVWVDPVPRDGPHQMACDEALLKLAGEPLLRIFRWSEPWISLGYFTPWQEAERADLPVCRRWTGGGVVVHEEDFTFALVAPRAAEWARLRPEDSYRVVHAALAGALREAGCAVTMFEDHAPGAASCFAGPVRYDLVNGGRKIAGGAQRRTKRGLLHQGSIQTAEPTPGFVELLAGALSSETTTWSAPEAFEETVAGLATAKYAREDFLRRN